LHIHNMGDKVPWGMDWNIDRDSTFRKARLEFKNNVFYREAGARARLEIKSFFVAK